MPTKRALDPTTIVAKSGTVYPPPYDAAVRGRKKRALAQALGLTQFGVNITELAPGGRSSLRHWHSHEDEFIYILKGEAVLITNDGEQVLPTDMCAGFPAGLPDGHYLENRSAGPTVILEVGSRDMRDQGYYSDEDLHCHPGRYEMPFFTRKNGEPL